MSRTAIYARVSTGDQSTERQISDCRDFLTKGEREHSEIHADVESGSTTSRDGIDRMIDDIENGKIGKVVTWEFSRIARNLTFGIEFIDLCIDEGVEIVTVNDIFPRIHGDGDVMDEMIGKFVAWMMDFNRQMTIERVKSGVQQAMEQGKWVGRPPFGFETDEDGFLVIQPEDYLSMQLAIEDAMLNPEKSVNGVARHYGVPQSTLDRALKDEERRRLYLHGESDDDRLNNATNAAELSHEAEVSQLSEELDEISGAIDELAEEVREG